MGGRAVPIYGIVDCAEMTVVDIGLATVRSVLVLVLELGSVCGLLYREQPCTRISLRRCDGVYRFPQK